jgi:UDP-N-acetylglucosamine--N-acetylmuramyl-(pentapeptide) pyrophosphoryl-undecaprenol N-acetylglucosamine transferase
MAGAGTFYIAGGGTGGHLYPGLAIADALKAQRPELRIFFVGAHRGIERTVLPGTPWPHQLLDLHPLYRSAPWQNWKTVRGMFSAFKSLGQLMREHPAVGVLGTGGYAAGALLGYARMQNLPFFLQEQNALAGLTVRFFSSRARATYLGFPEAAETLPASARGRVVVTGNPIAPPPIPLPDRAVARARWGFGPAVNRVLLVFGGSQGSRAVNDAAAEWLRQSLPENWGAIWITGRTEFDRMKAHATDRIKVVAYQQPMADAYAAVDLAVARAGAMSTAELCAWGIPMVLIPLPTAAADHQTQNAAALAAADAARMITQSSLPTGALAHALDELCRSPAMLDAMGASAHTRARSDAAQTIAAHILTSLNLQ